MESTAPVSDRISHFRLQVRTIYASEFGETQFLVFLEAEENLGGGEANVNSITNSALVIEILDKTKTKHFVVSHIVYMK